MKKIWNFVKKKLKLIIAFLLGFILASGGVIAATIYINGENVGYDNTSGKLSATTVQGAIDELYEKTGSAAVEMTGVDGYEINSSTKYYNVNDWINSGKKFAYSYRYGVPAAYYYMFIKYGNNTYNIMALDPNDYKGSIGTLRRNFKDETVRESSDYIVRSFYYPNKTATSNAYNCAFTHYYNKTSSGYDSVRCVYCPKGFSGCDDGSGSECTVGGYNVFSSNWCNGTV